MQIIATADHNQALTVLWGKDLRASFEMFVVLYIYKCFDLARVVYL